MATTWPFLTWNTAAELGESGAKMQWTRMDNTFCEKGRTFVIAPLSRQCHRRGAQVHSTHQAASDTPALDLPSRSRYSFTDPERMEG